MRKELLIICLAFITANCACSQDTSFTKFFIGDLEVNVKQTCFSPCTTDIIYINIHENESTSIEAAAGFLKDFGGRLVELKHTGNRLFAFRLNNQTYSIDPNRMFTPAGRQQSMSKLGLYKKEAALKVKVFADALLDSFVENKKLVIALHNNTDSGLSILSYNIPQQQGMNAEKVYVNEEMDPDDFILTTDTLLFSQIVQKEINVVLQSSNAVDDGSLSVYAQKKNILYINVEAEHGHLEEQLRMLEALKEIISQLRDEHFLETSE